MKALLLFIAALAGLPNFSHAEISPISLRVEQVTGVETGKFTKTQEKSLKIHLTNGSATDINNLAVKYYFFGRGAKDRETAILEKGERSASVKSHATELVETPVAKATATEEHYEKASGGPKSSRKKGSGFNQGKKVAASGEKLTGYGVQVHGGGKVLAEYFSEPSLKEKVGGTR